MLTSEKKVITTISRGFNKSHLHNVLSKLPNVTVTTLLNVKDKQNVPLAVRLIELIGDLDEEGVEILELDVLREIKLFGKICINLNLKKKLN